MIFRGEGRESAREQNKVNATKEAAARAMLKVADQHVEDLVNGLLFKK